MDRQPTGEEAYQQWKALLDKAEYVRFMDYSHMLMQKGYIFDDSTLEEVMDKAMRAEYERRKRFISP